MSDELMKYKESNELYLKITNLIKSRKTTISQAMNAAMIFLYWEIGETICLDILNSMKADYGKSIVEEVSVYATIRYWHCTFLQNCDTIFARKKIFGRK